MIKSVYNIFIFFLIFLFTGCVRDDIFKIVSKENKIIGESISLKSLEVKSLKKKIK